jgi:hypothetical protein
MVVSKDVMMERGLSRRSPPGRGRTLHRIHVFGAGRMAINVRRTKVDEAGSAGPSLANRRRPASTARPGFPGAFYEKVFMKGLL